MNKRIKKKLRNRNNWMHYLEYRLNMIAFYTIAAQESYDPYVSTVFPIPSRKGNFKHYRIMIVCSDGDIKYGDYIKYFDSIFSIIYERMYRPEYYKLIDEAHGVNKGRRYRTPYKYVLTKINNIRKGNIKYEEGHQFVTRTTERTIADRKDYS